MICNSWSVKIVEEIDTLRNQLKLFSKLCQLSFIVFRHVFAVEYILCNKSCFKAYINWGECKRIQCPQGILKEGYLQIKVFCLEKIKDSNLIGHFPQIADRAAIPQP